MPYSFYAPRMKRVAGLICVVPVTVTPTVLTSLKGPPPSPADLVRKPGPAWRNPAHLS